MAAVEAAMVWRVPVLRADSGSWERGGGSTGGYIEKRQLFLRSYQFSRKRSSGERLRRSLVRAKRLVWTRLRAARKLPRLLWARFRCRWLPAGRSRRRMFHRLVTPPHHETGNRTSTSNCWSW